MIDETKERERERESHEHDTMRMTGSDQSSRESDRQIVLPWERSAGGGSLVQDWKIG